MKYTFVLDETVHSVFAQADARQQRILLDAFRGLAEHPFKRPDFFETDAVDRKVSVISYGEWLVCYWVDHAIARVVIVEALFVDGN